MLKWEELEHKWFFEETQDPHLFETLEERLREADETRGLSIDEIAVLVEKEVNETENPFE